MKIHIPLLQAYFYAGCPHRGQPVLKKRVGYLFGRRVFILHRTSQMVMTELIEPGLKPD